MTEYVHPYRDAEFLLSEIVDFDGLSVSASLDDINTELASVVLNEAGKLASEVLASLNKVGDMQGARLEENQVQETQGFKEAYQKFIENGWGGLTADEAFGGQNLPNVLGTAVDEIWHSANMAFALCPMLTKGAIEALSHHGSDVLKERFLEKLISGEWTGTMNLTEPDAGSDLAAIKTKAVPENDYYRITGQKIFITWGDHQMTENIIHLVLARLPDAPVGVKGISLFIVPKFIEDEQGCPTTLNDVSCVSLEHKLGIHGSPTCTMSFGDHEGAIGYLVGEPHKGLAYMFTMMNHARQSVGLQGLSISERAYQQTVAFAKERLQGTRKDGSRFPIIEFPDVRRMLMQMKASIEAMRGLAFVAAAEVDRANASTGSDERELHQARLELFTPIVKGWLTELAQEVTYLGIQVHGGMGYVEETGIAQHYRDARILTIYEGTTGIQAMDFIGRKTLLNSGQHLDLLLSEMEGTAKRLADSPKLTELSSALLAAVTTATQAKNWVLDNAHHDKNCAGSVAHHFLMLFGYLCGAWVLTASAEKAQICLNQGRGDKDFLSAKITTAKFYAAHLLPRADSCYQSIKAGSEHTMALNIDQF